MLAWQLAREFDKHNEKMRYQSFIGSSATIGIGLGCFVLIVLLSIMNGFERELTSKLLTLVPHAEISAVSDKGLEDWESLQQFIESDSRIKTVSPYVEVSGLLQKGSSLKSVSLYGMPIDSLSALVGSDVLNQTQLDALNTINNAIILGRSAMQSLSLQVGDPVTVLVPHQTEDLVFKAPKRKVMTIVGEFSLGGETDVRLALLSLEAVNRLKNYQTGAQGLRLVMHDPFVAPEVVREYGYNLQQPAYLLDWTRTHGHIFDDIQLVRIVVYIVLTLVIAVACFNVVSTMMMSVKAKQPNIAILLSMGASRQLIAHVFMLQGLTRGFIGTLVGSTVAVLVTPYLGDILAAMEQLFETQIMSGDVYFIDYLPVEIQFADVVFTVFISLALSLVSSLYPAKQAAKVQPANILS